MAASVVGAVSLGFLAAFLVVSLLLGSLLSVAALALEEFNLRRHVEGRDAARLVLYAVAENVGFRQLADLWRILAFADLLRRRREWGATRRRGLGYEIGRR